ncbi:MAG TPA: heme A synthase [Leucothrix mucor]|nr:heme A synthase [Leucothrix mucor]
MSNAAYFRLIIFTAFVAYCVVLLGAYTRLSDAGLGCPDWPGCYGHLSVPSDVESIAATANHASGRALDTGKAWKEMIHRYLAGSLGLLILAISILAFLRRKKVTNSLLLPFLLLVTVIFQAALGMWTVTLQLKPIIVVAHLLGGFSTFSLLILLALNHSSQRAFFHTKISTGLSRLAVIALLIVIGQITLGGWVSSNYAALACADFPKCQGSWLPTMDFKQGFSLLQSGNTNYEFGVLENAARTAIHYTHRVGALITFIIVSLLVLRLFKNPPLKGLGILVGSILLIQVSLGISNVVFYLPLPIAVSHNGGAALLLITLIYVNYRLWQYRQ